MRRAVFFNLSIYYIDMWLGCEAILPTNDQEAFFKTLFVHLVYAILNQLTHKIFLLLLSSNTGTTLVKKYLFSGYMYTQYTCHLDCIFCSSIVLAANASQVLLIQRYS